MGFLEHAVFSGFEVSPVPFPVLREEASPLELPSVPPWAQCHTDDRGVVCRDFQYVKEYHQWPVLGSPFAAVGSHQLVRVVQDSFGNIIIHDDLWF